MTAKRYYSTVTTKGQVTIPLEVRRLLGVTSRDRVAFEVDDDQVRLAATRGVVARTAGACRSSEPALSAEELRAIAEQAIADETCDRAGG